MITEIHYFIALYKFIFKVNVESHPEIFEVLHHAERSFAEVPKGFYIIMLMIQAKLFSDLYLTYK